MRQFAAKQARPPLRPRLKYDANLRIHANIANNMRQKIVSKNINRKRRHVRVRAVVSGTAENPRLNVFRGLKHVYAQLIDDDVGKTLAGVHSKTIGKGKVEGGKGKIKVAFAVGKALAEKAIAKGVGKAVFDRAGYKYHGRVKAVAEGAREGGLKF